MNVNIVRHEMGEADRLPHLKKGAKCILFLKPRPRAIPPWETVDFWFGYQPYSSTLARALQRVAGSKERKDDARGADDKKKAEPRLTFKSVSESSGREGVHWVVFNCDGAGHIHRSGPEHFKLTRVSDGKSMSLSVEYDRETLDEQDRLRTEGTPRNVRDVTRAVKKEYGYNSLFKRVRLFLDNGPFDEKDPREETDCLDLYARAKLEAGVRYRLTWACWPVGAVKAKYVSVEFEF